LEAVLFKSVISITIAVTAIFLWPYLGKAYAAEIIAPKEAKFLGMQVATMDLQTVRQQLWQIGGFKISRSTRYQHNIDKYFPKTRLKDSYKLTFHYNDLGKVTRFTRVYRPYSNVTDNDNTLLTTRQLANELASIFGGAKIERKGYGGFRSYLSYSWEDDVVKIRIDRIGGHPLGDVFVEYKLKQNDPYAAQSLIETQIPNFVMGI
jgi:hypothetical protein